MINCMKYGLIQTAEINNLSKGRIAQIFKQNKHLYFMNYELYDDHGKERNFVQLRKIFNKPF